MMRDYATPGATHEVRANPEQSGEVVILRHGRLWSLLIAAICALCVAGVWAIRDEASRAAVWLGIIFFGFGVVLAIVRLLPGANYLRLDPTGFTYCVAFYRQRVAWSDVSEFGVVAKDATHAYSTVGFNYVPRFTENQAGRELAKSVNGWEGALPGTYGRRAAELSDLMNEWLRRSDGSPVTSSGPP
jgi:hypothetical protein